MKKILVVEDNEEIRTNVAEILELSSYKVIQAKNGKEGIEKAISEKPDLIICDIMMPLVDGYGVLHAVHKNDPIKNTPFIFLTAKSESSDLRKGMNLGADDYITKPFDTTELLDAVDARLKKIDSIKEEFSAGLQQVEDNDLSSTEDVLKVLIENADVVNCRKKQMIYCEGTYPNRLYYILEGRIKVSRTSDDGKELVTEIACPGDFVGYVPLLESSPYQDSAVAIEEGELAVIPRDQFEILLNKNNHVAQKFIRLLAKNISERENQLINLAYHSLRKKVAVALLTLLKKFPQKDGEIMLPDLNRENLATIAGTAKESLIRTLSDFKSEQLIELHDHSIIIKNEKKLANMIN